MCTGPKLYSNWHQPSAVSLRFPTGFLLPPPYCRRGAHARASPATLPHRPAVDNAGCNRTPLGRIRSRSAEPWTCPTPFPLLLSLLSLELSPERNRLWHHGRPCISAATGAPPVPVNQHVPRAPHVVDLLRLASDQLGSRGAPASTSSIAFHPFRLWPHPPFAVDLSTVEPSPRIPRTRVQRLLSEQPASFPYSRLL